MTLFKVSEEAIIDILITLKPISQKRMIRWALLASSAYLKCPSYAAELSSIRIKLYPSQNLTHVSLKPTLFLFTDRKTRPSKKPCVGFSIARGAISTSAFSKM